VEIIAGSLNIVSRQFLHAGYMSAYPRTFTMMGDYQLRRDKLEVLDVKTALELKRTDTSPAPTPEIRQEGAFWKPIVSPRPAVMSVDLFVYVTVFFFFAYLASLYYRRVRKVSVPGWRPWVAVTIPACLIYLVAGFVYPASYAAIQNSQPPPWEGVATSEYLHPEQATEVILYGIIADALAGCSFRIENLAAIQKQVGLPIPEKQRTEGMAYALKTYGRDGWGRDFRLRMVKKDRNDAYEVRSAGRDGRFDTLDDLTLLACPEYGWESRLKGVYVRQLDKRYAVFLHRVKDSHFRYVREKEAWTHTGTRLYDMVLEKDLDRGRRARDDEPRTLDKVKKQALEKKIDITDDPFLFVRFAHGN
jgi:hypothetical protein